MNKAEEDFRINGELPIAGELAVFKMARFKPNE